MRVCLIVALLLVQGLAVAATDTQTPIYRTTDADGNVVFTDNPSAERPAEAVQLKPTNSMPMGAEKTRSAEGAEAVAPTSDFRGYTTLRITSPKDGVTLRDLHEPVAVKVRLSPSLQAGDQVRIIDNGEPLPGDAIAHADRGTHTLHAEVVDENGDVLIRSASITVYVHRTSVSGGRGGASGSGLGAFGHTAHTGEGSSYGGASHAGGAASAGSASSYGHTAAPASSLMPAH